MNSGKSNEQWDRGKNPRMIVVHRSVNQCLNQSKKSKSYMKNAFKEKVDFNQQGVFMKKDNLCSPSIKKKKIGEAISILKKGREAIF